MSPTNSALLTSRQHVPTIERVESICSGQNLTSFKMATRVPLLPTLQGTPYIRAFFWSQCCSWPPPDPLRYEASSAPKTSALSQAALTIIHPRSPSRQLIFFTFITCNATQRRQLWTMTDFPTFNPNKSAQLFAVVTTSRHVQIVQLQRSRPHHLLNRV